MPSSHQYLYWDACVFLSYINGDIERVGTIESVLDEVRDDEELTIVTSVVSKVEVAFSIEEQCRRELDPAVEARLDAMWADRSLVIMVELNDEIARLARGFVREGMQSNQRVKPLDALHLATAQWVKALEIHTYDDHLLTRFGRGFVPSVCEPHAKQGRLPFSGPTQPVS